MTSKIVVDFYFFAKPITRARLQQAKVLAALKNLIFILIFLSGDILQFGVDVMENSRKVTHGCIIATLKLYLPDGKEAKASPTIVNSTSNPALLSLSLPTQDLYQLNQYIQEALAREQVCFIRKKISNRRVTVKMYNCSDFRVAPKKPTTYIYQKFSSHNYNVS